MDIIFEQAWIVFVVVTCINGYIFWQRAQKYIKADPTQYEDYKNLLRGYLIYLNIPWVVMGIGVVLGFVDGMFDYMQPRQGNLYVWLWHGTVVGLWGLAILWIYFRGGAEFLAAHPVLFERGMAGSAPSAMMIKLFTALTVAAGVFAMIMMWGGRFLGAFYGE
jgi:hypothetical protein